MATEQEKYYKRQNDQAAARERAAKQRENQEKKAEKARMKEKAPYSG